MFLNMRLAVCMSVHTVSHSSHIVHWLPVVGPVRGVASRVKRSRWCAGLWRCYQVRHDEESTGQHGWHSPIVGGGVCHHAGTHSQDPREQACRVDAACYVSKMAVYTIKALHLASILADTQVVANKQC